MTKVLLSALFLAVAVANASPVTAYCNDGSCPNSLSAWPGASDPNLVFTNLGAGGLSISGPGGVTFSGQWANASTPVSITGFPTGVTELEFFFNPQDLGPQFAFYINGDIVNDIALRDNVQSGETLAFVSTVPITQFNISTTQPGTAFQLGVNSFAYGPVAQVQPPDAETPEVATVALIGSGLAGMGLLRRKRRAARGTPEMMQGILDSLPEAERRALAAYYNGVPEHEACAREGVGIGKFRDLRAEVRGMYFRAVNEKALPPEVRQVSPLEVALLEA